MWKTTVDAQNAPLLWSIPLRFTKLRSYTALHHNTTLKNDGICWPLLNDRDNFTDLALLWIANKWRNNNVLICLANGLLMQIYESFGFRGIDNKTLSHRQSHMCSQTDRHNTTQQKFKYFHWIQLSFIIRQKAIVNGNTSTKTSVKRWLFRNADGR